MTTPTITDEERIDRVSRLLGDKLHPGDWVRILSDTLHYDPARAKYIGTVTRIVYLSPAHLFTFLEATDELVWGVDDLVKVARPVS